MLYNSWLKLFLPFPLSLKILSIHISCLSGWSSMTDFRIIYVWPFIWVKIRPSNKLFRGQMIWHSENGRRMFIFLRVDHWTLLWIDCEFDRLLGANVCSRHPSWSYLLLNARVSLAWSFWESQLELMIYESPVEDSDMEISLDMTI